MQWKPIPDFTDYEVSEHGDVRRGARTLKAERVQGNGRKRFALAKNGRTFRFKASQLVARAFIGPPPFTGAEVCHDDSFEHNNHYTNLRWDTRAGNVVDILNHKIKLRDNAGLRVSDQQRLSAATSEFLASRR